MKWSVRIVRVGNVTLAVHGAFLLLLGWEMLARWLSPDSPGALPASPAGGEPLDRRGWETLQESLFVLGVFASLLLHELGHFLAAGWLGLGTREVTLFPLGGIARLDRMPAGWSQEVLLALSGPLVNLLLAAAILGWLSHESASGLGTRLQRVPADCLTRLFWVNLGLLGANLLPGLPLDGGRVLRAVLARKENIAQATQTAASMGQGLALLAGFLGLVLGNVLLLFLALCVWIGATHEASLAQQTRPLAALSVRQAMIRDFRTLRTDDSLAVAIGHVLAGFPHDFPVEEDGRLVGMLLRGDLLTALAREGSSAQVGAILRRDYPVANPAQTLQDVLEQFQDSRYQALPVVEDGKVVGLLTMDSLGDLLALGAR